MQNFIQKNLINKAFLVAILAVFICIAGKVNAQISKCDSLTSNFNISGYANSYTFSSVINSRTGDYNPAGIYDSWNFGDGTTKAFSLSNEDLSTPETPVTHVFPTSTSTINYTVCRYVYWSGSGCKIDTTCKEVTIPGVSSATCNASFTLTMGPNAGQVNFTNTSTSSDSITQYSWVFGPNYPVSYLKNPTNTYTASGTYGVCLGISTKTGCTSEWCDTITVTITKSSCDSLSAYYDYSDTGDAYYFYNTYAQNPVGYHGYWKFGDGTTSTSGGIPTTHTFPSSSAAETYDVCFYVYLPNSTCTSDSFCRSITVPATTAPCNVIANYTYSIGANGSVSFTDLSTGGADTWSWYFADGSSSTSESPTHVFTTSGRYNVCLRAGLLSNTACYSYKCDTISVTVPCSVNAAFQYDIHTTWVSFYPTQYGTTIRTIWNFGDGTTSTDSADFITHTFPVKADTVTYNVCHIVYSTNTTCKPDTTCMPIKVPGTGTCNAKFSYTTGTGSTEGTVTFTNESTSTDSIISYSWVFGPNIPVSTAKNPTYTYTASGTYGVCLGIESSTGCTSEWCDTITVTIPTKSSCDSLSAYFFDTNSGNTYTFENSSTHNPAGSQGYWRFGDGTTIASGIPVTHTFPTSSIAVTYDVCFFVYLPNSTCPTDSFCREINVAGTNPAPCDSLNAYFLPPTVSGTTYTFTASSNPIDYHQYWTFGDGTTGSGSPVTHTFPASSSTLTYDVCHVVYYPNTTCKADTFCRTVTVPGTTTGTCKANFTWVDGNTTGSVIFTNASTSSDSITSYRWYFGDNSSSTEKDPTHTYTGTAASYVVCMYITSVTGCNSEKCDTITVTRSSCDSLSAYYLYSDTGTAYYLYNTYAQNPVGYHGYWSFGDGTTSTTGIPTTHTFPTNTAAVTYTVCFHVYLPNATCPTDSFCRSITVAGTNNIPPCDSLTSNFDFTSAGDTFVFISAHNPTGYHQYWTFGDGTTSTVSASPITHIYAISSVTHTYTVCHYVYYPNATCKTDTTCEQVVVPGVSTTSCKADFTDVIGSDGSVAFTDISTGTPTSWRWSFGDNSSGSTEPSPTHTYTASGTYRVCLNITTATGCTSEHCDTVVINLSNPCNVNSNFQYIVHTTWVSFYPSQTSGIIYANWSFGDGTTSSDDSAWITHSFPVSSIAVTYHVCHIVYASTSPLCADTTCEYVVVPGTPTNSCNADFVWTLTSIGAIDFTDLSTASDAITSWRWRFGDGDSSSAQSPSHTYNSAGKYRACLNITTAGGCTSEFCDTVTVSATNPCTINSNYTYTNTGDAFTFTSVQNSTAAHQYWTFGDGSVGSGSPVNHTYTSSTVATNYTVCHVVYLPGTNCVDTTCKDITVPATNTGSCNADYTWTLSTATGGLVAFTNTSTSSDSVATWTWYFGDGSSSDLFAPTHTYAPGVYYTCLRLYSVSGCLSYHCDSIHIAQPANNCNAQFTYQLIGCDTVQFINNSTGSYTHTAWNFGDGTSSSEANPTHVFATGTWTVTLYAYNPSTTCTSSISDTITIQPCNTLNDTICGVVFSDNNSNGVMDSTDVPYANIEVQVDNNVLYTDSFGHYLIILPAGTHRVYIMIPTGCIATIPLVYNGSTGTYSYYVINGSAGGNFCGYNFGINCNVDHICGKVFYDTNNNGVQDSTESGLANLTILITGANGTVHHAYTNSAGEFCETVPSGSYTITIDSSSYSSCVITPLSINVNATGNGQSYIGNNFAVYCPPGAGDLDITITPNSTVTPGFPAWYSVEVCNIGGSPMSGTATFVYDPTILTYNYSLPPQNASVGNTVSWNFTNLAPGQCVYYWVDFNATAPLTPGQPVYTVAIVTPASGYTDANPNNNIDTLHQEVMASWDPNSKQAFLTNYSNPSYQLISSINSNQRIEYTINFENDGNANAINIVVDDNLSPDLDANSFEMLSSSYPCAVTRNGSALNVKFSNINLPPSSVNEPGSHGYVKYAINSVNGLPAGHVISDPAMVYFDYNAPVTTGNANVTMLDITGVNEVKPAAIVIGPNPMGDYTQVTLQGSDAGSFKFRVMDMTGRIVTERQSNGNTLLFGRNNLAAGMYSYYVIQNNVIVNIGKLVIE